MRKRQVSIHHLAQIQPFLSVGDRFEGRFLEEAGGNLTADRQDRPENNGSQALLQGLARDEATVILKGEVLLLQVPRVTPLLHCHNRKEKLRLHLRLAGLLQACIGVEVNDIINLGPENQLSLGSSTFLLLCLIGDGFRL